MPCISDVITIISNHCPKSLFSYQIKDKNKKNKEFIQNLVLMNKHFLHLLEKIKISKKTIINNDCDVTK